MEKLNNKIKMLNIEQKNYVLDDGFMNEKKAVCIIAFAGTGKSTSLIIKIARMILKLKLKPEEFFITTFTRNAGLELKERLKEYLQPKVIKKMTIGTFHSIAYNFYKEEHHEEELIENEVDKYLYYFNDKLEEYIKEIKGQNKLKKLITKVKNNDSDSSDLCETNKKFKYKYIFIDEYQDVNPIQEDIIRKLHKNSKYLTVVGDPQQNIYAFRNTDNSYIINFSKNYENSHTKFLVKNYRSNPAIIEFGNVILKQLDIKQTKCMEAKSEITRRNVVLTGVNSFNDEMMCYFRFIETLKNKGKGLENMCILARTNSILQQIEKILVKANIPVYYIETKADNKRALENIQDVKNKVILATCHSCKGLEWDYVFISNFSLNVFPSFRCDSIEDEKRLFYVSSTRPRKQLNILFRNNEASPFIFDVITDKDSRGTFVINGMLQEHYMLSSKKDINDVIVTGILESMDFKDYEYINDNIFDFKKNIPEIIDFNKKCPEPFNIFCKKKTDLLLSNILNIFGDFLELFIDRVIAKHKNLEIKDNHYESMVLKTIRKNYTNDNLTKLDEKYNTNFAACDQYEINEQLEILYEYKKYIKCCVNNHEDFSSCYDVFTSNKKSSDIIFEIFVISLTKTISRGREGLQYIVNFNYDVYNPVKINKKDIEKYKVWLTNLEKKVEKFYGNYKNICSSKNVNDRETNIKGIIDILADDTIIELKAYNKENVTMKEVTQALSYAAILKNQNQKINYIIVQNPIYGYIYKWDISNWDKYNELLVFMKSKINN